MLSPSIILSFVLGYFLILIVLSWLTSKDARNEEFFIGERKSPWYLVAFGMIGASLSGVTFISIPGVIGNLESANGAFSYMQMVFGYLLGYIVIATVLMPLYYRLKLTSIYSYLDQRFGFFTYKTGAFYFLLSRTIGASFRLFLVAIVLQKFVFEPWGVPFPVTVLLTLLLIWIYTFRGGIKTIVWTDSLQTLFMLVAVGVTIYTIGSELQLGLGELITTVKESEYSQMFFWNPKADNYFFKQFFSGAFIAIVMTGLDQDMMQKNNSCKNIGEAQLNMFFFSITLVIVNLIFVSLGALLYLYADAQSIAIPDRTDYLFPSLAINHFSVVAGVAFIIGLVAAAYSSADSALTSLTTSFCIDFLDFEKKDQGDAKDLKHKRYLVHIMFTGILFLVIMAFQYLLKDDVISNLFKAAGFTYGPLLGLYAFGLFSKRTINDKFAPLVCILSPVISYLLNANSESLFNDYKFGFEILMVNGLLTIAGLFLISKRPVPQKL